MKGFRQCVSLMMVVVAAIASLHAAPEEKAFHYQAPVIEEGLFGDSLTMLVQERGEYAENLAKFTSNLVNEREADAESLAMARRLLAVALHLSPRSKNALVVNFQLKSGVLPAPKKTDYSPEVLARLLLTRAQLLSKQEAEGDRLLARCFVELAALIDARNEDAVYAYQIQTIDHGEVDWNRITAAKSKEKTEVGKN